MPAQRNNWKDACLLFFAGVHLCDSDQKANWKEEPVGELIALIKGKREFLGCEDTNWGDCISLPGLSFLGNGLERMEVMMESFCVDMASHLSFFLWTHNSRPAIPSHLQHSVLQFCLFLSALITELPTSHLLHIFANKYHQQEAVAVVWVCQRVSYSGYWHSAHLQPFLSHGTKKHQRHGGGQPANRPLLASLCKTHMIRWSIFPSSTIAWTFSRRRRTRTRKGNSWMVRIFKEGICISNLTHSCTSWNQAFLIVTAIASLLFSFRVHRLPFALLVCC